MCLLYALPCAWGVRERRERRETDRQTDRQMEDEGGACEREGCGGVLSPRLGKFGIFWGCSNFSTSARCRFTRRPRKPDGTNAAVVLEAESVGEFRLYLRLPPAPRGPSRRKRKREQAGSAGNATRKQGSAGIHTLQDVIALLGQRPLRLDTRPDGPMGAVYRLPGDSCAACSRCFEGACELPRIRPAIR